jgi:uncharacterized protein
VVTVTFRRDSRFRLSSVFSEGHAESGEPGEDVVCAAVSAILQSALLGLTDVAHVDVTSTVKSGHMSMAWPENVRDREDVRAIMMTAELSIESIAHFNAQFVRFERADED